MRQDVLCLVVDVLPAVSTRLQRSHHIGYRLRVTGEPSDQGRARVNGTSQPWRCCLLHTSHSSKIKRLLTVNFCSLWHCWPDSSAFMCVWLENHRSQSKTEPMPGISRSLTVWILTASEVFLTHDAITEPSQARKQGKTEIKTLRIHIGGSEQMLRLRLLRPR